MAGLSYIRLEPISWSQQIRCYPGNDGIGYDEGGYLSATCRAKADCNLVLRNKAKLRDYDIPISVVRADSVEEMRQEFGLAKEPIGGLWFVEDQNFVHGWFHFNERNFTALWDQVLHGTHAACEIVFGVRPVRNDLWGDNPLSIVSTSVTFHRPK